MKSLAIWHNVLLFLPAAAVIWWAGGRLERYTDAISRRTGMGAAFSGMLLLASATSLPELATTVTAVAVLGDATLAVHNLLGGVALQTALLVVADAAKRRQGALTFFSPRFALLIQGVGLVLLLQLAVAGISSGGKPTVLAVSVWLLLLPAAYVLMLLLVYRHRGMPRWTPSGRDDVPAELQDQAAQDPDSPAGDDAEVATRDVSLAGLWRRFAGCALLVLAAGWLATSTAEALAVQTGIGSAFIGATLLALATSLPELSTTVAAARRGRLTVAVSNVFGSNAFDVALLFVADLLYRQGSIVAHVEGPVIFLAMVASVMTCLYIWGLLERGNRTVLGVGWDSAAVLLAYLGGVTVLYFLD